FGGINALRDLFTWIGVGLLPLTVLYGTTRAMLGERGPVAVPLVRVLGIAAVLVSYPYWWTQAAAMTDTVTHLVLGLPRVAVCSPSAIVGPRARRASRRPDRARWTPCDASARGWRRQPAARPVSLQRRASPAPRRLEEAARSVTSGATARSAPRQRAGEPLP